MEVSDHNSGVDPQAFARRAIKSEPVDDDEHIDMNDIPNGQFDNNETNGEHGQRVRLMIMKEEIKDEMEEEPRVEQPPEEQEEDYCFCGQTTLVTDFMIACEKCDMWFHGPCVEIDTDMSAHIKKFYCKSCSQQHRIATTYKKSFAIFMDRRERKQNAAENKRRKKEAAQAKKLTRTMKKIKIRVKDEVKEEVVEGPEQVIQDVRPEEKIQVKIEVKEEVKEEEQEEEEKKEENVEVKEEAKEEEHEERAPRCEKCINCTAVANCQECYYCTKNIGRCIKVICLSVITDIITDNKPKTPEPAPTVSPKGSSRRKTQRKRKSGGDSDDDELFFSESTSTRSNIKKELSFKEEQQLEKELIIDEDGNVVEKKKRGRRKGWRKDIDGKKKEGEEGEKKEKKSRRRKKKEEKKGGRINRLGRGAEFLRQNGPENMEFPRREYDTTLGERLQAIAETHAELMEKRGLITKMSKSEKCKNTGCEAERRHLDDYCSEECGMRMSQIRLANAGFIAKPLEVIPKKKRRYENKASNDDRLAKEEARRVEWLSDLQEAEYQKKKKAEKEAAKNEHVEPVTNPDDLIPATIRQLQRDVAKILKAEEDVEREKQEKATAEHERQRKIAEAEYRARTSYIPMAAQATLNNGMHMLMAQPVVRPVPLHPNGGMFPPQGYFNPLYNPFLNPLHVNGIPPSIPMPIRSTISQAMLDHNDYLPNPIIPLTTLMSLYPHIFQDPNLLQNPELLLNPQPNQNNPSPSDNSSPSTLSSASPVDTPVQFAVPAPPPPPPAPAPYVPPVATADPKLAPVAPIPSNVPVDSETLYWACFLASMKIPIAAQPNQPKK